jgi:hypothetical protein
MPQPAKKNQTFGIRLTRLPKVRETPGLIQITINSLDTAAAPRRLGNLTDAAVRSRLAHFGAHSANELAALRQELRKDRGQVTISESWASIANCLHFWHGFTGSQIRTIEWTCEHCGCPHRDDVGASVGESFLRACKCGECKRITVTTRLVPA